MKCKDIIKKLEDLAPVSLAYDWDNVGLLLGRQDKNVSRILVTLDVTADVIDKAVGEQVDMIISHHPMIFESLKQINADTFLGRNILHLMRHDICVYAMHTNFDVAEQGMGAIVADLLNLSEQQIINDGQYYTGADGVDMIAGLGRIGHLEEEITLTDLCQRVKTILGLKMIRVYADSQQFKRRISEIAVLPGSGKDEADLEAAIERGAEVYISGDIPYHMGVDAIAKGIIVIDVGHYALEKFFIEYIEQYLSKVASADVQVTTVAIHDPGLVC